MYVHSQFEPSVEKFFNISDVPSQTVSLREAARSSSIGLGQGFFNVLALQAVTASNTNITSTSYAHHVP